MLRLFTAILLRLSYINRYLLAIVLLTCIPLYSTEGTDVKGPLKVLPPDNECYELDASSILCLACQPPVLVIATSSGTLQHLALLQDSEVDSAGHAMVTNKVENVALERAAIRTK